MKSNPVASNANADERKRESSRSNGTSITESDDSETLLPENDSWQVEVHSLEYDVLAQIVADAIRAMNPQDAMKTFDPSRQMLLLCPLPLCFEDTMDSVSVITTSTCWCGEPPDTEKVGILAIANRRKIPSIIRNCGSLLARVRRIRGR